MHSSTPTITTTIAMAQAVKKKLVVCGGNGFLGTFVFHLMYAATIEAPHD